MVEKGFGDVTKPPSPKELLKRVPTELSVKQSEFQTHKLSLRTEKGRDEVWIVGYRRVQTDKRVQVTKSFIKTLMWSDQYLINALAKAWLGLKERGAREAR